MTEFCVRCGHAEEEHGELGLCEVPHCRCLGFVGEDEDDDEVEPLDFGHEDEQ